MFCFFNVKILQMTEGHDVLELMEQMGSSSGATRYEFSLSLQPCL